VRFLRDLTIEEMLNVVFSMRSVRGIININFIIIIILPGGSGTTIRLNTQMTHITQNNTHHAQTEHSTQNYTNNKGQPTNNECNANTLQLQQIQLQLQFNKLTLI
jgi:ABC-type microcin C transport system permease subunit YejB